MGCSSIPTNRVCSGKVDAIRQLGALSKTAAAVHTMPFPFTRLGTCTGNAIGCVKSLYDERHLTFQEKGIIILSLGIGNLISNAELRVLASEPKDHHVFHFETFDGLETHINEIEASACGQDLHGRI